MKKINPFRQLELQLQLKKLEQQWEEARQIYNQEEVNTQSVDEILKITLEKIKVLAEMYMIDYQA